ncbi:unnamed protein product [Amoebophrya sp. A25]|nr:unnamed protein product [Amoebophrya sp. A25]|eukprot:GSA25T00008871001.1
MSVFSCCNSKSYPRTRVHITNFSYQKLRPAPRGAAAQGRNEYPPRNGVHLYRKIEVGSTSSIHITSNVIHGHRRTNTQAMSVSCPPKPNAQYRVPLSFPNQYILRASPQTA